MNLAQDRRLSNKKYLLFFLILIIVGSVIYIVTHQPKQEDVSSSNPQNEVTSNISEQFPQSQNLEPSWHKVLYMNESSFEFVDDTVEEANFIINGNIFRINLIYTYPEFIDNDLMSFSIINASDNEIIKSEFIDECMASESLKRGYCYVEKEFYIEGKKGRFYIPSTFKKNAKWEMIVYDYY